MALTCTKCGGTIADIGGHIGVCLPSTPPSSPNPSPSEGLKKFAKESVREPRTQKGDRMSFKKEAEQILFELKYGKNFTGTVNMKPINTALTSIINLVDKENLKARLVELDLLEQAINANKYKERFVSCLEQYKLQRLADLETRLDSEQRAIIKE